MKNPLVSIVIPNYNRSNIIGETLASIKAQTYPHWEAIIVDDGSTDNSREVITATVTADSRFSFFQRTRSPKGAQACRNIGLEKSKGEYVIFLDSDDLLAPQCLEQRVKAMQVNPELAFAIFPIQIFLNKPGDTNHTWLYSSFGDNYLSGFLLTAQWQTTSPIWKRDALVSIQGWDESLDKWQDWDIHVRALIAKLPFQVYPKVVDSYCRRGNERMSSALKRQQMYQNRIPLFNRTTELLQKTGLLSPLNKKLMAGNYLTLACRLYSINDQAAALETWQRALDYNLVNLKNFTLGKLYMKVRTSSLGNKKTFSNYFRKVFSLVMPEYVIWKY